MKHDIELQSIEGGVASLVALSEALAPLEGDALDRAITYLADRWSHVAVSKSPDEIERAIQVLVSTEGSPF